MWVLLWISERFLSLVMACVRSKKFESRCQICGVFVETGLFAMEESIIIAIQMPNQEGRSRKVCAYIIKVTYACIFH